MKLTKSKLREIIREELLNEEKLPKLNATAYSFLRKEAAYLVGDSKDVINAIKKQDDLETRNAINSLYGSLIRLDHVAKGKEKRYVQESVKEQKLNEDDFASKALDLLYDAREDFDTEISKVTKILKHQDKIAKTANLPAFNTIYKKYIDGFYKVANKIARNVKD